MMQMTQIGLVEIHKLYSFSIYAYNPNIIVVFFYREDDKKC